MELESIKRRIYFEVPNTINLKAELWDKQPSNRFLHDLLDNSPTVSSLAIIGLVAINILKGYSFNFLWFWISIGVVIAFNIGLIVLYHVLTQKQRNNQLSYRRKMISPLNALFQGQGFVIPEEEQTKLTTGRRAKFKLLSEEGVRYRTYFIGIDDEKITATLYLSDKDVSKRLNELEHEKRQIDRMNLLVEDYEAENGPFASPELREAFLDGARRASK